MLTPVDPNADRSFWKCMRRGTRAEPLFWNANHEFEGICVFTKDCLTTRAAGFRLPWRNVFRVGLHRISLVPKPELGMRYSQGWLKKQVD